MVPAGNRDELLKLRKVRVIIGRNKPNSFSVGHRSKGDGNDGRDYSIGAILLSVCDAKANTCRDLSQQRDADDPGLCRPVAAVLKFPDTWSGAHDMGVEADFGLMPMPYFAA